MENTILLTATLLAGCAAVFSLSRFRWKYIVRIIWSVSAGLILTDLILLILYLAGGQFEYSYVYAHTSAGLASVYKISALWSGQEGSFLLWASVLAVLGFWVPGIKENKPDKVFGIYALISFCIFLMCFISQPFAVQMNAPTDGLGMPQALQDPWMVVHPPLVFIAYSAMGVLAALSAAGDTGTRIIRWARISWFFLGMGIFAGSIWAYRALGWGGYWSWDPIENAALIPWLILSAYLHDPGKISRVECILPFLIACCGTFLARSGILADRSAHAYAGGDSFISLVILFLLLGGGCWIAFLIRRSKQKKEVISKAVNLKSPKHALAPLLYAFAALIACGTAAPLLFYFDTPTEYYSAISIFFACAYVALLLAGDLDTLRKKSILMMAVGTALVIGISAASGWASLGWILLLWFSLMPLSLWIADRFKTHRLPYYLVHTGILLLIAGVITSSAMGKETMAIVQAAPSVDIGGSSIVLADLAAKGTMIASQPLGDVIVQYANIVWSSNNDLVIPYSTRPFVILFWAGGFMTILGPLFARAVQFIKSCFTQKKS